MMPHAAGRVPGACDTIVGFATCHGPLAQW
jgi:hypothetical protein